MTATTTQFCELRDFSFQDGTTLPSARLAYLDLNPTASKTALVITCFRGRLKSTLNFSDGALRDHRVIVVALFGNGESSSPSNTDGFPSVLDYRDCVHAQHKLLTSHLKLASVDVVLGFSMGGQCTYHWTVMYPEYLRNAVIICSSARTSRHNHQFLEGPKAALESAVDYVDKTRAVAPGGIPRGVRAFGKAYSAWLTSAEWFDQQAYTSLGYQTLSDWDRVATETGYEGWDADDLLVMLGMWQRSDVTAVVNGGGGIVETEEKSLERALSRVRARVLLMPCRTDQYFRPEPSEREASSMPTATLKIIESIWGHIAGGGANKPDTEWMDRAITEFLA